MQKISFNHRNISGFIRQGKLVLPTGGTKLQLKDILFILTVKEQVANVKLVLAKDLMI